MTDRLQHPFQHVRGWFIGIGVLSIIGGILALADPFIASITVATLAAWFFLIVGIVQIVQGFQMRGQAGFWGTLLWGGLMLLMAVLFILDPLAGVMSLTLLAAVWFLLIGTAKVAFALNMRPHSGWGWVAVSGAGSLALAAVILIGYPTNALAVLGLLFGLELLFNGTALLMLGLSLRRL